jgi:hypothetical protein
LSNASYRLIFLGIDVFIISLLIYLLSYTLESTRDIGLVNQLFTLGFYLILLYFPFAYLYRSITQIGNELVLNASIYDVRNNIKQLRKRKEEQNIRSFQVNLNKVRNNLRDFIDVSMFLSPPIYNYELDRLQKRIDIFFNTISEVLFPIDLPFSREERIEQQQTLDYYRSLEHPTKEEMEEEYEAMLRAEAGEIDCFDREALDESMLFLGDALFARTKPFSPFSQKHPINLIMLSSFFDRWNSIASRCSNCKKAFEKAKNDIEEYYKVIGRRERQRRQRMWRLRDDIVIVAISVILSTIVQYLIKLKNNEERQLE